MRSVYQYTGNFRKALILQIANFTDHLENNFYSHLGIYFFVNCEDLKSVYSCNLEYWNFVVLGLNEIILLKRLA